MATASGTSSFLLLPAEVRLQIYEHIFAPETPIKLAFACDPLSSSSVSSLSLAPRTFGDPSTNDWLIFTRKYPPKTLHPCLQPGNYLGEQYKLRVHRSSCPDLALLRVSKQTYCELLPMVYRSLQLDFTQAFPALPVFSNMLSPFARSHLSHVILRAPFHNATDRILWATTCDYIRANLVLGTLTLEYRYRSGCHWTPRQWRQKLRLDPMTRRPSDAAVAEALSFGADTLMMWEDVVAFESDDSNPKDLEFLQGLPLETEDEMRDSLGLRKDSDELLDSSLAAVAKIRGLERLDIKVINGALTTAVIEELKRFLMDSMLRKEG